ncbi:unnamed protein product, partial [Didymodactylos carnosus]
MRNNRYHQVYGIPCERAALYAAETDDYVRREGERQSY